MSRLAAWPRHVYSLLLRAAQPLLRRKLARRGRTEPGYLEVVEERFGHYAQQSSSGWVWVHAVSLGETRAAAILVTALRAEWARRGWPFRLLLTHGTATGRAEGLRLLQPGDVQVWQPWDTPAAVQRFLGHFRPAVGLLMETEVWPNLSALCREQGLPLVLVNARLNETSLRSAERWRALSLPAYGALAAVWAQSEADATRLRRLGAPVRGVFGNLKFDAEPDATLLQAGRAWAARARASGGWPVLMLASAREGEEAMLIEFLRSNRPQASVGGSKFAIKNEVIGAAAGVQWLVVPRHPQRFDEVVALFEAAGCTVSRRSGWGPASAPEGQAGSAEVWVGDSLGEMAFYYGLADAVLLGGSFAPLGGQNLIEAAACGCPVYLGPHTFNFAEAARLAAEAGAAEVAPDLPAAARAAEALVQDPSRLAAARTAAQGFAQAHKGAAARTAGAVADWLATQAVPPSAL